MSGGGFAEETHYRARRLGPVMRTIGLVGGAVLAATAFESESPGFRLGIIALGAAWALYGVLWAAGEGLYTDRDGVRLRWELGTRRFAWREIEAFRVSPWRPLDRVMLVTGDGRQIRVPGISQGPMEWDTGQTRDAAGRLNAHLEWAKARQSGAAGEA